MSGVSPAHNQRIMLEKQKREYSDEEKLNYAIRLLSSLYAVTEIHIKVCYNDGDAATTYDWVSKDR